MQKILGSLPVILVASGLIAAGCGKKTMQTTPGPVSQMPAPASQPPPIAPTPPAPEDISLQLGDAFFDFDSAALREDALATLTADGRILLENTGTSILIEGHCDERGTADYNLALGERRAASAKNFLVHYGVASHRIATVSYGENRPFATGHNEAAWAQNRRAHFVVENP